MYAPYSDRSPTASSPRAKRWWWRRLGFPDPYSS
jgi:hypothetical protein